MFLFLEYFMRIIKDNQGLPPELCKVSYNGSPIVIEVIVADIDVDEVLEISQERKGCL